MKDIWNFEYVDHNDGKEHIVTFECSGPGHPDDYEYHFSVKEDGVDKILLVDEDSLIYGIKALKPIEGKTVSIQEIKEAGVFRFDVSEVKGKAHFIDRAQ